MESTLQLYLRLKIDQKDDFLDLQLQKRGFKLTKKSGSGIETFRNYYYEMTGAPGGPQISFKIMPGKGTTQIIAIQLAPDIHPKHLERLFSYIKNFATVVPLDLMDMDIRNKIYEQLHQQGKVDAYYVGLTAEEQLEVERQAFIPIDHKLFLERLQSVGVKEISADQGGRAPDLDK
jgi:hypothetical protein